ncbi:MAG: pseudouridine synthase [Methylophaga sp.]|nr:MAG: pseudouridine synthase [Methylophaga sp.]
MTKLIIFNKPYDVLTQFTGKSGQKTLKDFVNVAKVYPAGRLDRDSEGLVLLTDSGVLQHKISDPKHKLDKTYWVQVENIPNEEKLEKLRLGIKLKDGTTRPAQAKLIATPDIWPRIPPIRQRKAIPTQWIELKITEGKNRQVRRMTAAIGHPTLRLIRYAIGDWTIDNLESGKWLEVVAADLNSGMVKSNNDLDTTHYRRRSHRTRPPLSDGRGRNKRQDDAQSARRSPRIRRKPDRSGDT